MSLRGTRGTIVVLFAAAVLRALTQATGGAWLELGSAAALALLPASLLMRPRLKDLQVSLAGPNRVLVGDVLEQVLVVHNPTRRHTPPVRWIDRCPGLEPALADVAALAPGETVRMTVRRKGVARGRYTLPSSQLGSSAPFGVLGFERLLPPAEVFVHPRTDDGAPLQEGAGRSGPGIPMGVAGPGLEVLGLRPWRAGDSSRDVSARASARHGRPVVLEREHERTGGRQLVVLAVGGSAGADWEDVVSQVASRTLRALVEGWRITLRAGEGGVVPPRVLNREAVLDFFAGVDPARDLDPQVVTELAKTVHPGGAVLVLAGRGTTLNLTAAKDDGCCIVETYRG